jgi:lycopene beta-cyclase
MTGRTADIAIVGGGLAGGLIALALRRARPDLAVVLVEAGPVLGGNHRWSWFGSDLAPGGARLLGGFRKAGWPGRGYEVRFPGQMRVLGSDYHSLASADFDATLRRELAQDTIRTDTRVAALAAGRVELANGEAITARAVIDCRDGADWSALRGGWQVFMGRHMKLAAPHGLHRPVIMDAAVAQEGGYRFVYVLPTDGDEVFIEDTYYQDTPVLDQSALGARIEAYAAAQGWQGEAAGCETGVLPVITGGDFAAFQRAQRIAHVAQAGARGGFVHPLTSYTMPFAVSTALAIAANADLPGDQLAAMLEARARNHWRATGFYRMLGRMLFAAARPEHRWRIFARFYRLDEALVERFYAGRSTWADRARILVGRPPVPIGRALSSLVSGPPPLCPKDTA